MIYMLCAFASLAFAASEENYGPVYQKQVVPFYQNIGRTGTLQGVHEVPLSYIVFESPHEQGAIVVVSGQGESYASYAELAYDLWRANYSVYLMDHRGQGYSGRILADSQIGHVEEFDYYVQDLKTFIDKIVPANAHAKRYVLAHSMGGAVAALYLARYPSDFDAALLSAPMMEIRTGLAPARLVYGSTLLNELLGKGEKYAIGQSGYDFDEKFSGNEDTHSRARFEQDKEMIAKNTPLAMGGPSNRWLKTSFKAMSEIQKAAGRIRTPILLFQAGEDRFVGPAAQTLFCRHAPNCRMERFPEAKHSIFRETDPIRNKALALLFDFFGGRGAEEIPQ